MRLAGEDYMNYSENYFATLSLFNSAIQREIEDAKFILTLVIVVRLLAKVAFKKSSLT
jgi:hypothetical protein